MYLALVKNTGVEPRIAESNSAVLPLHHISMWLLGQDYDSQMLFELPKNKWRMAQDLNLWSSTNDFSLAKRHNKPLCQPSIWSSEQELNLYLSRRYDCAIVTPSLDILPPYNPCCIFRPRKDCNLRVLCSYTSILIGGRCYSVPVVA